MSSATLAGHVAVVTGANHGIGAATAVELARRGSAVLLTYLRLAEDQPAQLPAAYAEKRSLDPSAVVIEIRAFGGQVEAIEADLTDPCTPALLFDAAEAAFGPVDVLVNNASGWVADTFRAVDRDQFGRPLLPRVRPAPPRPRPRMGADRQPDRGRLRGLPGGGFLRRGEGGAHELHPFRELRTRRCRGDSQCPASTGHRHRLGHLRGSPIGSGQPRPAPHRHPGTGRPGHRISGQRRGGAGDGQRDPAEVGPGCRVKR